jgi:hypothetical protein
MLAFLAGVAILGQVDPPPQHPYSCRLLDDEQKKVRVWELRYRAIEWLQAQCQRDEKRLPQVRGPRDGGQGPG